MKKNYAIRYLRLLLGLMIVSIANVCILNAGFGCNPWEVLATGMSNQTAIPYGTCNILIGILILLVDVACKEKIGIGSIFNLLLVGNFINGLMYFQIIPVFDSYFPRILQLVVGVALQSYGICLYMMSALGAGPRDTLMVCLSKKFHISIGTSKLMMEIIVVCIGTILGGKFGVGTILLALFSGYVVQFMFHLHHVNPKTLCNRSLSDEYLSLKNHFSKEKE